MSFADLEVKFTAEMLRLLETTDGKVPHSDKAFPLFKQSIERYRKQMDDLELAGIDFDEVERRNDEKLDAQEVIEDESDCDSCKI